MTSRTWTSEKKRKEDPYTVPINVHASASPLTSRSNTDGDCVPVVDMPASPGQRSIVSAVQFHPLPKANRAV
jgi:hypothetical protein